MLDYLSNQHKRDKPAVLLMHGLYSNGLVWFANDIQYNVPFILAESGYDVWIASSRATTKSKHHIKFQEKDYAYWDYTLEDIGRYDLPAFIDFILEKTGQSNLSYVCNSMGCTELLISASLSPEYFTSAINLVVALAPLSRLAYTEKEPNFWYFDYLEWITPWVVDKWAIYDWTPEIPITFALFLFAMDLLSFERA